ncbi:MAG: tetratricopeptide repeat-containing protein [Rhodospirillaceae bacterium]|nr:tetratricopeptide repeat-containing protein [Rhodospirillaceae bacterium]
MSEAAMPPCILIDYLWEYFAEQAGACLANGNPDNSFWRTGAVLSECFGGTDPRRAASLHCRAVIARENGDFAGAEALYREAITAWERAPEWIADMAIEFVARSASMHIRLEMKRTEELKSLKRSVNRTLAEGGLAAVLGNLAEMLHAEGRIDEAEPLYVQAREMRAKSLSHREVGVAVICDNLADLLEAEGRPEEAKEPRNRARKIDAEPHHTNAQGFAAQVWHKMTDIRKLTAAVYLAPPCLRAGT